FTVSQIRVAATCPRIHYFDAEHTRRHGLAKPAITRIWKAEDGVIPAGGARFHRTIEGFNRSAREAPEVRAAIAETKSARDVFQALMRFINETHVDLEALGERPVAEQKAFVLALQTYVGEVADLMHGARERGTSVDLLLEQLFGDPRRRVDVTF